MVLSLAGTSWKAVAMAIAMAMGKAMAMGMAWSWFCHDSVLAFVLPGWDNQHSDTEVSITSNLT